MKWIVTAGLLATLAAPQPGFGATDDEIATCRRTVNEEAERFGSSLAKLIAKCHDARIKGKVDEATDCNDLADAAVALGKTVGTEIFDAGIGDSGGDCDGVDPEEVAYTSCPSPCGAMTISDWPSVDSCMRCVMEAHVEELATNALGQATLPLDADTKRCAKALLPSVSKLVPTLLNANTRCINEMENPEDCLEFSESGRIRIARMRGKIATKVTRGCATASYPALGTCATALGNAGCVMAKAEQYGTLLAYDARRLAGETFAASPDTFVSVAKGEDARCGLRADGSIECWHDEGREYVTPPGRFTQIAIADGFSTDLRACGLRPDGSMDCWPLGFTCCGGESYEHPPGTYAQVSGSGDEMCARRTDGTLVCFGHSVSDTPSGTFKDIAVGDSHSCAIRDDDTVLCWNYAVNPEPSASGAFTKVAAGRGFGCGLRPDQTIECWGNDAHGILSEPAGTFVDLAAVGDYACALATDHTVACWGDEPAPPSGTFLSVDVSDGPACGVRTDGYVECWGDDPPETRPDLATYESVAAGGRCALKTDGAIHCRGSNSDGQATPPPGTFMQVSTGTSHGCAIRDDQTLACWGSDSSGQATAPAGTFAHVSSATDYNCGVRTNQTLECWGFSWFNHHEEPPGSYLQSSAGYSGACGLQTDGSLECWGTDYSGSTSPLPVEFLSVSSASRHHCGVTADRWVQCWGENADGSLEPPFKQGPYVKVETGDVGFGNSGVKTTCALRPEGSLECWPYGRALPPPAVYRDVAVPTGLTACGVLEDGTWRCWGRVAVR